MPLPILSLLIVLVVALVAGRAAERLGYPPVLGELLAGILVGPPILGLLHSDPALNVIAELGIILMMLYVGMEIDPVELRKASRGGLLAAIGVPRLLCSPIYSSYNSAEPPLRACSLAWPRALHRSSRSLGSSSTCTCSTHVSRMS
jgi:Kef-type K+ transport system membrane component KefB